MDYLHHDYGLTSTRRLNVFEELTCLCTGNEAVSSACLVSTRSDLNIICTNRSL